MCFIRCINYFTKKDHTEKFQDFIIKEKYRSGVLTSAGIQPRCKKYDINVGCFDGMRIIPRNTTRRNISLCIYNDHFCLVWKSNGTSFDQAIEKLKLNL